MQSTDYAVSSYALGALRIRSASRCFQVLHLLAMARAAGVDLELNDFQAISDRTPFLADLKPSGRFVMEDVHKVCSLQRLSGYILL